MKKPPIIISMLMLSIQLFSQKPVDNKTSARFDVKAKYPTSSNYCVVEVESPLMILNSKEKSANFGNYENASNQKKVDSTKAYIGRIGFIPVNSSSDANKACKIKLIVPNPAILYVKTPINDLSMTDYVFAYNCKSRVQVTGADGSVILDQALFGDKDTIGVTKEVLFFNPELKLKIALNKKNPDKQKELIEDDIQSQVYFQSLKKAQTLLKEECVSYTKILPMSIYSAKGKEDYKEYEAIANELKDAMDKTITLNSKNAVSVDVVKQACQKAITFWENELKQENTADEKAKVNAAIGNALRYNLAVAYLWTGNYAKAKEYIVRVPESEFKSDIVMQYSFKDLARTLRSTIDLFIASGDRCNFIDTTKK